MKALRYAARHRGLVVQWFGVLAPPAAWSVQFLASYNLSDTLSCSPGAVRFLAGAGAWPLIAVLNGLAAAVTVVAGAVSYRCWTKVHTDDPTPGGRAGWLAIAGIMSSGLFLLMIAASFLPLVFLSPCSPV